MSRLLIPIGDNDDFLAVVGDENNVIVTRYNADVEQSDSGKFNVTEWIIDWEEWDKLKGAVDVIERNER